MKSLCDTNSHLEVMKVFHKLAVFLKSSHFECETKTTWEEAFSRMEADTQLIKYGGRQ
jgi:hypothetical protein